VVKAGNFEIRGATKDDIPRLLDLLIPNTIINQYRIFLWQYLNENVKNRILCSKRRVYIGMFGVLQKELNME